METDRDHVHFLIRYIPGSSISQMVRKLKQESTHQIWLLHPGLLLVSNIGISVFYGPMDILPAQLVKRRLKQYANIFYIAVNYPLAKHEECRLHPIYGERWIGFTLRLINYSLFLDFILILVSLYP